MSKTLNANRKAYNKILRLKDGCGRLGFEISNHSSFLDCWRSYDDIGYDLSRVIEKHPDDFDVIEETIIAICGYGFESLLEFAKEDKDYYYGL